MPRKKFHLRYYRNVRKEDEKLFANVLIFSFVVAAIVVGTFAIYLGSLPSREEEAKAKEDLNKAEVISALSALPSNCQRDTPVKNRKQDGYTSENKNDKSASKKQVENFYVMGVQLYTPVKDAMIAAQASGNFKDLPEIEFDSCASDWIERNKIARDHRTENIFPEVKKSCIKKITYSGSDVSLIINFVEDYPKQPSCLVVSSIGLNQRGRENSASIEVWSKALQDKYGPPHPFSKYWGAFGGAELNDNSYYGNFNILLNDSNFIEQREQAVRDAISDAKPTAKPKL